MKSKLAAVAPALITLRLFVISYAPLAAMVAIRASGDIAIGTNTSVHLRPFVFWCMVTVAAWGALDTWRLPRLARQQNSVRVELSNISDESGAVAGYLATYLLPLLGYQVSTLRDVSSLAIYGIVLFVVFARSDLGLVNPSFYLTGQRVVSADSIFGSHDPVHVRILSPASKPIINGETYNVVRFGTFYILK